MAENLPDVPREDLTLLQRLSSKEYKKAMAEAAEYRANLEQVMAAANATEAIQNAREDELKSKEADLERRIATVDAREKKVDKREAAVTERETETAKRAEAVGTERNAFEAEKVVLLELLNKVAEKEGADQEWISAAKTMLENLRLQNSTEKTVSKSSVKRDYVIIQVINAIKEKALDLKQAISLDETRGMTAAEKSSLNLQKANLRAGLIGAVCAYRDSLPETDRYTFSINGKSCATFLEEQTSQMIKDSAEHRISSRLPISEAAYNTMENTYYNIINSLGCSAKYTGSHFGPFDTDLELEDSRRAGVMIFQCCYQGEIQGLDWSKLSKNTGDRYPARISRATTDVKDSSVLESEITDVAKIVEEDWEK